ncbi:polyprotein of retroviral origin, putative, partial [Ixodes scapularis]
QLTTPQPIHVRQYPLPLAVQDVVENEITEMLKLDVIERCTSSYNAPVVIVKKKDGSNRFCIDYRRLNDVIHPDAEPIPRIDMTLVKAGQKRFFSKLDVAKGYWQIPMDDHAKEKTSFSSTSGHYQFKFMPFGLKTASATFTKLMRKLLDGVQDAHHYIDDILVATSSWEDHIETLRTIFERLRAANITVKPKKCQIGFEEISFLGHEIGMGNIAPDAQIIERVRDAPRPQTKRQVRSFL